MSDTRVVASVRDRTVERRPLTDDEQRRRDEDAAADDARLAAEEEARQAVDDWRSAVREATEEGDLARLGRLLTGDERDIPAGAVAHIRHDRLTST